MIARRTVIRVSTVYLWPIAGHTNNRRISEEDREEEESNLETEKSHTDGEDKEAENVSLGEEYCPHYTNTSTSSSRSGRHDYMR